MKYFPRRSFLKTLGSIPIVMTLGGCAKNAEALLPAAAPEPNPVEPNACPTPKPTTFRTALEISSSKKFKPGYLSIIQGPTSDRETLINVVAPRLKKYKYVVIDQNNREQTVELYSSVVGPGFHNVDKIKVSALSLGTRYTLRVIDSSTVVDERSFYTLDISNTNPRFGMVSCMADDHRFTEVIDPMWDRLKAEKPEFLILNGDIVYVDSFEFVARKLATEFDIWQRYTDSLKRIPLYHWDTLVPLFATWDDHDFGTNDGDRNFAAKDAAFRLFNALFGGKEIAGVWSMGPQGVCSSLNAFGQRFYFMDDRTFRQPNKDQIEQEIFGQWGQTQHEWLLNNLAQNSSPAWIINGNQCFNGKDLSYKESFEANHPKAFVNFVDQLKTVKAPVVFASGDIHLSEIMRVPKERIGYETYEFTSSSMHSYAGAGWDNPMRINGAYTIEYNFFMVNSRNNNGSFNIDVQCLGLSTSPYFEQSFVVKR